MTLWIVRSLKSMYTHMWSAGGCDEDVGAASADSQQRQQQQGPVCRPHCHEAVMVPSRRCHMTVCRTAAASAGDPSCCLQHRQERVTRQCTGCGSTWGASVRNCCRPHTAAASSDSASAYSGRCSLLQLDCLGEQQAAGPGQSLWRSICLEAQSRGLRWLRCSRCRTVIAQPAGRTLRFCFRVAWRPAAPGCCVAAAPWMMDQ